MKKPITVTWILNGSAVTADEKVYEHIQKLESELRAATGRQETISDQQDESEEHF